MGSVKNFFISLALRHPFLVFSFLTHEITNDFVGVTEKHAYRRGFDGTIDLTFYVMTSPSNVESAQSATPNRYLPIRFFEAWMKYIAGEKKDEVGKNYAYRMRYPKEYYGGLSVIKYERDYKTFFHISLCKSSRLQYLQFLYHMTGLIC